VVALEAPVDESLPGLFFPHEVNNTRDAIVSNIKRNAARGLPELKEHEACSTPLLIVAGGPSVRDNLEVIRAMKADCHVMAVNGAYRFLREHGIESDHFVLLDSRPGNITHVEDPGEDTNHCLASQVHPDLFERLRDHKVTIFHPGTEATMEAVETLGQDFLTAPIGIASIHAVYVAAALGYRTLMLFGYDFSERPNQRYAFDQPLNADTQTIDITLNGNTYRTTLTMARAAQQFSRAVSPVIRGCSLDVRMFSEGLLTDMLKTALAKHDEDSERAKYEQIWGVDAYRSVSPALNYVQSAVNLLNIPTASSIADFGCGTGRSTKWFKTHGLQATGVDISSNSLEEEVPFVQCALWDADKLPQVDYGFSVDVLEHIPTEKVRDTLQAIHDAVRVACYLNIDTVDDAFGVMIGQPLHLTVMPAEQWERLLKEIWREVTTIESNDKQAIFVCRK